MPVDFLEGSLDRKFDKFTRQNIGRISAIACTVSWTTLHAVDVPTPNMSPKTLNGIPWASQIRAMAMASRLSAWMHFLNFVSFRETRGCLLMSCNIMLNEEESKRNQ